MWRDNCELVLHSKVGFLLSHGALGDTITSLPAIIYARATHVLEIRMTAWVRADLVPLVSLLAPGVKVKSLEDFNAEHKGADGKHPFSMNSGPHNTMTRNKRDMVDFAFNCLLDTEPFCHEMRNYPAAPLGPRTIAEKYVALTTNGVFPNRTMRPALMKALLEGLLERGLKPVILGKSDASVPMLTCNERIAVKSKSFVDELPELLAQCIDLREKTGVLEARDILGHAEAVIGIDGGLLHLAGTTDVPIVYGLTIVAARHRGITRHDTYNWRLKHIVPRELACSGCQSNWTLVFGHNYKDCAYNDNLCIDRLHPQDFLDAFDDLQQEKHNG
jgi:hypothetical protein